MGQYYTAYIKRGNKQTVFDNKVDGEWTGLKLMEHSWWRNSMVGNVVNSLFYKKSNVCWVGDYYCEDAYAQINVDKQTCKAIGDYVAAQDGIKCYSKKVRFLNTCLLVNHTKKCFIDCDKYFEENSFEENYDGEKWVECIHPLPLLTCSASHSGGSYYGTEIQKCGTWFNDEIEVVLLWEKEKLLKKGYQEVMYHFKEN